MGLDWIDIVIPVLGGTQRVGECLEAVLGSCDPTRHEVIVVVDGDAAVEVGPDGITLLRNEDRLGFSGCVNRGAALHPGRDVVLLDGDSVVFAAWVDRLIKAWDDDPRIGTVSPLGAGHAIGCYPGRVPDGGAFEIADAEIDQLAMVANVGKSVEVPMTDGSCMLVRRACLDEAGPFGEGDESAFCERAAGFGWRHVVAGDVFVRHWAAGGRRVRVAEGDEGRTLRAALDLARVKRMLAGRDWLACVGAPGRAEGVHLVFEPGTGTLALAGVGEGLPDLPRPVLAGEIEAVKAMLRELGVTETRVGAGLVLL